MKAFFLLFPFIYLRLLAGIFVGLERQGRPGGRPWSCV